MAHPFTSPICWFRGGGRAVDPGPGIGWHELARAASELYD